VLFPRPYSSELGALTFDEVSNMRKLVRYCDGTLIAVIFIVGFFTYFVRGFDPVQREHLAEEQPHIVLTLDTTKTIELSAFVGAVYSRGSTRKHHCRFDSVPLVGPFIDDMQKALIVEKFVRVGKLLFESFLFNRSEAPNTRSELKDWVDAVKAIATLEASTFEDGQRKIRVGFKFKTPEARDVLNEIEMRQQILEMTEHADHTPILMRFSQDQLLTT
jgi:hypothetical protein